MSTQTKTLSKPHMQVVSTQTEMETPAFSMEFLAMLQDGGWDTLRSYLESQGIEPKALELLDVLLQLHSIQRIYDKETQVLYIWNHEASDIVARLSKAIPALGGHFMTRYGEVLKG